MKKRPRRTEVVENAATVILAALKEQTDEHYRTVEVVRKWLTEGEESG